MQFPGFRSAFLAACAIPIACAVVSVAGKAGPAPAPAPTAAEASESLPLIGRVRAATPFCRTIVTHAASLAGGQLADNRTTIEAMRILTYAPLDRDVITEHRAVRALETLSSRLMASRQGEAQVHVAGLRAAARGDATDPPREDLARFAGALDGAHSESSRVAHEISRALSVLEEPAFPIGGVYLPDDQIENDVRFAPARAQVAFPVDPELERFSPAERVQNGPLHAYARNAALRLSDSLDRMIGSIDQARQLFPAAFGECAEVDVTPSPAPTTGQ